MYQPFSRSNLVTPGIRLFADPAAGPQRNGFLAPLLAGRGATIPGARHKLRDYHRIERAGDNDKYLGQHLEFRIRWDVIPGNLRLDTGGNLSSTPKD